MVRAEQLSRLLPIQAVSKISESKGRKRIDNKLIIFLPYYLHTQLFFQYLFPFFVQFIV